ncbi:hypothetical protein C8Q78DRAFT_451851 [Trametes maxima]|nr:hypothetical protein C8Q78DRAFT_451851 [Trametes maxima]
MVLRLWADLLPLEKIEEIVVCVPGPDTNVCACCVGTRTVVQSISDGSEGRAQWGLLATQTCGLLPQRLRIMKALLLRFPHGNLNSVNHPRRFMVRRRAYLGRPPVQPTFKSRRDLCKRGDFNKPQERTNRTD